MPSEGALGSRRETAVRALAAALVPSVAVAERVAVNRAAAAVLRAPAADHDRVARDAARDAAAEHMPVPAPPRRALLRRGARRCSATPRALAASAAGRLSPAEQADLGDHLRTCAACRALEARFAAADAAFDAALHGAPDDQVHDASVMWLVDTDPEPGCPPETWLAEAPVATSAVPSSGSDTPAEAPATVEVDAWVVPLAAADAAAASDAGEPVFEVPVIATVPSDWLPAASKRREAPEDEQEVLGPRPASQWLPLGTTNATLVVGGADAVHVRPRNLRALLPVAVLVAGGAATVAVAGVLSPGDDETQVTTAAAAPPPAVVPTPTATAAKATRPAAKKRPAKKRRAAKKRTAAAPKRRVVVAAPVQRAPVATPAPTRVTAATPVQQRVSTPSRSTTARPIAVKPVATPAPTTPTSSGPAGSAPSSEGGRNPGLGN